MCARFIEVAMDNGVGSFLMRGEADEGGRRRTRWYDLSKRGVR
jgi:hypothetical protein